MKLRDKKWNTARTEVYNTVENNILNCKNNSTISLVDECEIGKTHSARQIVKPLTNAFYID